MKVSAAKYIKPFYVLYTSNPQLHYPFFYPIMIHFIVPRTPIDLYKQIDCIFHPNKPSIVVSESLAHYLSDIKQRIHECSYEWDIYKKYTNPYEYIHTLVPGKRKCVSRYKPLSRSYFKMIEIATVFKLIDSFPVTPIRTFHLAEGPGGFIEAIRNMRNCPHDRYIGMTILDDDRDPDIPAWKKSEHFLKENPNVFIETGIDSRYFNYFILFLFESIHYKTANKSICKFRKICSMQRVSIRFVS